MKEYTVQKLIDALSKFDKNKKVKVQYRDAGGDYYGQDDEVYLIDEGDHIVL